MTRLTITIDDREFEALQRAAVQAMRPTKQQARYIIRSVLFGENHGPPTQRQATTKSNRTEYSGAIANSNN